MPLSTPSFWWSTPHSAPLLLKPLGWLYGAITRLRYAMTAPYRPPVPVICIGNFVAGGAGKTPVTIAICEMLKSMGHSPVILSRGYGGRLRGPVRVETHHTAQDVGDEPLLLARHAPVIISRDKVLGAVEALSHGDIILMDDGLQNPSLHKTITFAVVDGAVGVGNGHCLPAGPLRAPLSAQRKWVDALITIPPSQQIDGLQGLRNFTGTALPSPAYETLRGQRVLLYTGLARPEKIHTMLLAHGVEIVEFQAFPDHHQFTAAEAQNILHIAHTRNLLLVTTAKDHARLSGASGILAQLRDASTVLDIMIAFEDAEGLEKFIRDGIV